MLRNSDESRPNVGWALVAFSLAIFVFHQLPAFIGGGSGDWVDLLTPLVVIGAAALVLRQSAAGVALVVAVVGAVLYADGHGIHFAANSIRAEELTGEAKDVAYFWDEQWGHFEWHLGWFVLLAGICLAERTRPVHLERWQGAVSALLLGWALFVSTVEGNTWWLELGATAAFVAWASAARRPLLVVCAGAFGLAALLIGIWAIWHAGVPEFSDVGLP
jgi:hypothetical protein